MRKAVGGKHGEDLNIRRYLHGLRRRKHLILGLVVGMVGTAVVLSVLQTPVYEAQAKILLQAGESESPFDESQNRPTSQALSDVTMNTEIEVLRSDPVRAAVERELGPVPEVKAQRTAKTLIIETKVESTDPERAALVANAYARVYIDMRRSQAAEEVLGAGEQVEEKIAQLETELRQLDVDIAGTPAEERSTLTARRDALAAQQSLFKQRLDELQVEAALKSGGARLVASAPTPSEPVRPTPVRNAVLALVVGSMIGLGLASLLEYLDDRIRTKEDLAAVAGDLPVIGLIPLVRSWRKPDEARLPLTTSTTDEVIVVEAYRALRTSVQLLAVERPVTTVQVTSSDAREGKTTTVCNLAAAFAEAGQRVVVADCDLRRPRVQEAFDLPNDAGFTSVLSGQVTLDDAIQPVPDHTGLSVLASGPIPPNPSELLGSKRTSELLFELQSNFDAVFLDSPPVLPVTDATVLSAWVDATVLMASAGVTPRKQLRRTIELLRQVEAPLVGVILNQVGPEEGYGYGYAYRYDDDGRGRGRRRHRTMVAGSPNGHRGRRGDQPQTGSAVEPSPSATHQAHRGAPDSTE